MIGGVALKTDKRDKEARWVLLKHNWYALYTECTKCHRMAYCAGRYRDRVKCHECAVPS